MRKHKRPFLVLVSKAIVSVVFFPSNVYWRIVSWRMGRPRKRRYSDAEYELRDQLVDAIVIGRTLRANVYYMGGFGRFYRKHGDKRISSVAKELYFNAWKAALKLGYLLTGLELRLRLRMYAWQVLRRDNSDLDDFWRLCIDPPYSRLEEATKELVLLLKPEAFEGIVKSLAAQRPRLELPKTPEDEARASVQRFKGMLWQQAPMKNATLMDMPFLEDMVGEELLAEADRSFSAVCKALSAYARHAVRQLPEGEREKEMKEIRNLLERSGF